MIFIIKIIIKLQNMSHYYHHVLFIQSLLNCDMNTINETKFEVIYYDISLNTTIWDRKDNIAKESH